MNKLASTKVAEILSQVGPALRSQNEEIKALTEKLAFYQRRERVEKIASAMDDKNLDPDTSREEKVERLMASNDLDVVEKAIDLSAPQIKLAALSDHPGNAMNAEDAFVSALLGE